jgi:WD40 repeat protein
MRCWRLLWIIAGRLILASGVATAWADELTTEPMLRIDAQGHIAQIFRIATDAEEQVAVTASSDKTVRVWSLPDGKLERTLWLPSGEGNLGKAYAVALSPDGVTIAVGGWLNRSNNGDHIYLFDRASGALLQRLRGLPDVVNDLAYSRDGKRLVAALWGANGIRVFDASDGYRPLPSDTHYGDSTYSVDFDRDGRLVSASNDGFVRVYAADSYYTAVSKTRVKGIGRPNSVAFSPNGLHIAVGDYDSPTVGILRSRDLIPELFPTVAGFGDTALRVSWSNDGQRLFAGGYQQEGHYDRLTRRWDNGGHGPFADITGAQDTVTQFVPLRDKNMLFADSAGFGMIDSTGKVGRLQDKGSIETRGARDTFRISPDARTVEIADYNSNHVFRFALTRRAVAVDPSSTAELAGAITKSTGINLSDWKDRVSPKIDRKNLVLQKDEISRSIAVVPGADRFVLGADWSLRLFDAKGEQIWQREVPDVVYGVNVSANGKVIVAAYGDGTIRWHRASDGEELLALFMHPDGQRWIAWTPQGFYDASAGADDLIGWQVNHGYDRAPDFFPVSQFQGRFNRRDVIARVLDTLDVDKALADANKAAGAPVAKAVPLATSGLTPVVEIKDPAPNSEQTSRELSLSYVARMTTPDPIEKIEALIDGVTVKSEDHELLTQGDKRVGNLRLTMPLHDAKISVIAYNKNGPSQATSVQVLWRGPGLEEKPKLYVLAIGVTHYKASGLPEVHFPAKDAHDFVALAKAEEGGLLYGKVVLYPKLVSLEDADATRENILEGLDWIQHAVENSNDVAMVFLSGHGINTPDQHYRFLPYNYDPDHINLTTIADFELQQYITKIGGKTLFFFDTCFSGNVLAGKGPDSKPDVDKFANELRTAKNGVVVFASSTGDETSLEPAGLSNGAFTKAVVDGMRGAAARPDSKVISIADLKSYVSRTVHDLTSGKQHPTTAEPKTIEDYWIASVVP